MPRPGRNRLLFAILVLVALVAADLFWTHAAIRRIEADNPPRGTFALVEGRRIHVLRRDPIGVARGDIVLIHGASGNGADMMDALGDSLTAHGFRVWAPDRPGHGWSEGFEGSSSPAQQAQRLRAAMEALGVSHAIVVGHSLGGAVADNFAIDHPDFARGVVLVSPVTHPWPGGVGWYYSAAAPPILGTMFASLIALPVGLATIDAAVSTVFAPQAAPPNYVARTGAKLVLRPTEFVANARDVVGLKAFVTAQAPRETTVHVPVAIVAGDDTDTIVSSQIHSVASAKAIRGATLKILPGVGHAPHWVATQTVVDAIEDVFVRSVAAPAAAK